MDFFMGTSRQSLLAGLGNCDEIHDVQRKLRMLPKDLKALYKHMIQGLDEDYREEAIHFFQLANAAQARESDLRDLEPMTIRCLSLIMEKEETFISMLVAFPKTETWRSVGVNAWVSV